MQWYVTTHNVPVVVVVSSRRENCMPSFYGNMRVVYEHTNDSFTILGANESVEDIVFGVRSSALQVLGDRPVDSHVRLLYNQIMCLRF